MPLKGTTRKITGQGEFLNFLSPLMTAGSPFIKSILKFQLKMFGYHLDYQQDCQQQTKLFQTKYGSGTTALIILNK